MDGRCTYRLCLRVLPPRHTDFCSNRCRWKHYAEIRKAERPELLAKMAAAGRAAQQNKAPSARCVGTSGLW